MDNIKTKVDEIIIETVLPEEMVGKFIAENLVRSWTEDFVDEDTSEVVSIERNEVIMHRGTFLDENKVSEVMFFLQSKDIKSVKISNQKREAQSLGYNSLSVWEVIILLNFKKIKTLLYAESIETAILIIKDFIELNYSGVFTILGVKDYGKYIMIKNDLKKIDDNDEKEVNQQKYYKIEVCIITEDSVSSQYFVVYSSNADTSMILINDWISKNSKDEKVEFTTSLESASVITCKHMIEKDFSLAYTDKEI